MPSSQANSSTWRRHTSPDKRQIPAEKHRKTLAVGPSNSVPNRRSTHTSTRRGRGFETPENTPADKHHKKLVAAPSISYHGEAFALAEGCETFVVGASEVTQIRWDAESTSQLINLETTHACVITDLATSQPGIFSRSPPLDGIPSPRANSSTWRRHKPVSSRIWRQTKVTIIQVIFNNEECSQPGIFSRSPQLDGIPSPRANSLTWRQHMPVSSRIK
jgi:hypothetical protein